jgi:hypothetical protein
MVSDLIIVMYSVFLDSQLLLFSKYDEIFIIHLLDDVFVKYFLIQSLGH